MQNIAGVIWSLTLQNYLKLVKNHTQEINNCLVNRGCSETEIQALPSLPSDIYQTELNSYQRARLINLGVPISCGTALFISGEITTALIIIALGLLSFPIGEYFFKSFTYRIELKLRLGRSAQLMSFLKQVYHEHIYQTFQVNLLSQLPLLLFALRLLWKSSGNFLAIFFGFTQGLGGLSGTLAFQRTRAASLRTVHTATHLINALSSQDFIITPARWAEHCIRYPETFKYLKVKKGVAFVDFATALPSRPSQPFPVLNCVIETGESCIIQAPSGHGKSTLLLSLMHMLEHKGDLFFIKDGKWQNAHELTQEGLKQKIFFCREENIDGSARILDLFQEITVKELKELYELMIQKFGLTLAELAWKTSDNLIEQEICYIQMNEQSVFPQAMLSILIQMREERSLLVQEYLKNGNGNLSKAQIYPTRVFCSLSSGEKRRLLALLAFIHAKVNSQLQLIILDEPLAHLDQKNREEQISLLKKIQQIPNGPAQLIISHHFIDNLFKALTNVKTVEFQLNELAPLIVA